MAEEKKSAENKEENKNEREYIIPLRREWLRVSYHKRARRAAQAVKKFIARHMKVLERDLEKVKLDVYLNNQLWARGRSKPPAKVKVKVRKEGDIVKVDFADTPEKIKFIKAKHEKFHKAETKKVGEKPKEEAEEKQKEEKTEEQKEEETEKSKSVEQQNIKIAESQAKAQKHTTKTKVPQIHRLALKK